MKREWKLVEMRRVSAENCRSCVVFTLKKTDPSWLREKSDGVIEQKKTLHCCCREKHTVDTQVRGNTGETSGTLGLITGWGEGLLTSNAHF